MVEIEIETGIETREEVGVTVERNTGTAVIRIDEGHEMTIRIITGETRTKKRKRKRKMMRE